MIQLCTEDRKKTSEESLQPGGVIFIAIHDFSLSLALHELATLIQTFLQP